jgi:hypothetical protein
MILVLWRQLRFVKRMTESLGEAAQSAWGGKSSKAPSGGASESLPTFSVKKSIRRRNI